MSSVLDDLFVGGVNLSAVNTVSTSDNSPTGPGPLELPVAEHTSKTAELEAELLALLDTPIKPNQSATSGATLPPLSVSALKSSDDDDVLAWLQDSPIRKVTSATGSVPLTNVDDFDLDSILGSLDSNLPPTVSSQQKVSTNLSSVDDLDAIFDSIGISGKPSVTNSSDTLAPVTHSLPPLLKPVPAIEAISPSLDFLNELDALVAGPSSSSTIKAASSSYSPLDNTLRELLGSPFPDLPRLRSTLESVGNCPVDLRTAVLSLLISGSQTLDEEATYFTATNDDLEYCPSLVADCQRLVKRFAVSCPVISIADQERLQTDVRDLTVLFCQRRDVPYTAVYPRVLLSLIGSLPSDDVSYRARASGCFYSVATEFLPLVGLPDDAVRLCVGMLHTWLRLLVAYHSPHLVQHLDRVLPGWERPSESSYLSTSGATPSSGGNSPVPSVPPVPSPFRDAVESAPPKDPGVMEGMIPLYWITGIFSGSLPPSQSSQLLDWAVFNGERFMGLYLLATLLCLHESSLRLMTGEEISQWLRAVDRSHDWWKSVRVVVDGKTGSIASSPDQFVSAWLSAASALMNSTPIGYRDAVSRLEAWSLQVLDDQNTQQPTAVATANRTLAEHFSSLRRRFQRTENGSRWVRNEMEYAQDRSCAINSTCLWCDSEEVVPSICSTQRNTTHNVPSVPGTFVNVLEKGSINSLWLSTSQHADCRPFFFGIDCRTDAERALGVLPKALPLETESVLSGDGFADLLAILEPLRDSAHIALIGAGEDFYKWRFAQMRSQSTGGLLGRGFGSTKIDPSVDNSTPLILEASTNRPWLFHRSSHTMADELKETISEAEGRLAAVAQLLQKAGFRGISIVDGGFSSILRTLSRPETQYNLTFSVVDGDRYSIASLLGLPTDGLPPPCAELSFREKASPSTSSTGNLAPANNLSTSLSVRLGDSAKNFISSWNARRAAAATTSSSQNDLPSTEKPSSVSNESEVKEGSSVDSSAEAGDGGGKWRGLLSSFKKTVGSAVAAATSPTPPPANTIPQVAVSKDRFVVDESDGTVQGCTTDESKSELFNKPDESSTTIGVMRTDVERAQALSLHRLAGLRKGDQLTICRAELPGASLFPCTKLKEFLLGQDDPLPAGEVISREPAENGMERVTLSVARYLVVSKERFLVLHPHGEGVGSTATIKSNHHLSELVELRLNRKDPEMSTTIVFQTGKRRVYRVPKQRELQTALQKNVERFK